MGTSLLVQAEFQRGGTLALSAEFTSWSIQMQVIGGSEKKNIHSWLENMGDLYFSINHLCFYTSGRKQKSTFMTGYLIGVLVPKNISISNFTIF